MNTLVEVVSGDVWVPYDGPAPTLRREMNELPSLWLGEVEIAPPWRLSLDGVIVVVRIR